MKKKLQCLITGLLLTPLQLLGLEGTVENGLVKKFNNDQIKIISVFVKRIAIEVLPTSQSFVIFKNVSSDVGTRCNLESVITSGLLQITEKSNEKNKSRCDHRIEIYIPGKQTFSINTDHLELDGTLNQSKITVSTKSGKISLKEPGQFEISQEEGPLNLLEVKTKGIITKLSGDITLQFAAENEPGAISISSKNSNVLIDAQKNRKNAEGSNPTAKGLIVSLDLERGEIHVKK